ncbi:MAG TPA: nickel pincer cofactor biosynthesis protein LarC [Thermoanaerobaculia bacterium]|nr:nickel pincer cofactor biosynthesis protein LarC [Thermoanaerobaculia bacterium]
MTETGRHYHLDCFSGLAGDMFLGACVDLGMPLSVVEQAVAALDLAGVGVEARRADRGGLAGTRFRVLQDGAPIEGPDPEERDPDERLDEAHRHAHQHGHDHGHHHGHDHDHHHDDDHGHDHHHDHDHHHHGESRNLPQIRQLIESSRLDAAVKETAANLFARLGEAEAKAHGVPIETVHFHEVGAIDSIVDLVGAAAAYHHLAPERLTSSPVNVGSGTVKTAHGVLPVPAPATAHLVRGLPVHGGPGGELLTPTGAVILAELVDDFGDLPPLVLEASGYGLGKKHLGTQPNAVRLTRGRAAGEETAGEVVVIETEVDDLPAEGFGFLMERLLAAGALDVYFTPVQMKKNRPGTLITVLCRPPEREATAALLLAESGSLGCRFHTAGRLEAEREVVTVETPFGEVRVKRASLGGRQLAAAPEYEDCRRLALEAGVPWREVYRAAVKAV